MNFFGPPDSPLGSLFIDRGLYVTRDALGRVVWSRRRDREADVRALALEHEERASLGPVDGTEADISPGS